jgi:hypothetical protein
MSTSSNLNEVSYIYIYIIFFFAQGGGHIAAENMVKECAAMIDRWMAYFPL